MFNQVSVFNKHRIMLFMIIAVLALVASACQSLQSSQANIPEVDIIASEYTFDSPAEIEAGMTYIKMENQGEEIHHVQLLRINDDVTMDEFQAALQQGAEAALPLVTLHGGVGLLPPGGSGRVLVDVPEGQYVLACFVPDDEDGLPHLAKGMLTPLKVVASSSSETVQAPNADAEVTLKDFNFVLPEEINSGKQIWKVTNEGPQPHEMILLKLGDNMTAADVGVWMESMEGPPPFEPVGGMQGLNPGDSGYVELDLSPGSYIASCDIPDPASGTPHAELGMLVQFDVQ